MEKRICAKCQEPSDNGLPLCDKCREGLQDFGALATYLNSFKGNKEDLYWIIGSEISSRESSIISHVKIDNDYANGIIKLVPIEPSGSTLGKKPWLWEKYLNIKRTIDEIAKLRRALIIIKEHYGAA